MFDPVPVVRLGPGGSYTRDIHAHDLIPSAGPSPSRGGPVLPESKP